MVMEEAWLIYVNVSETEDRPSIPQKILPAKKQKPVKKNSDWKIFKLKFLILWYEVVNIIFVGRLIIKTALMKTIQSMNISLKQGSLRKRQ